MVLETVPTLIRMTPVTLQINLAPTDYRHARLLLPHQLKTWSSQVAEILLVVDLRKGAGRFAEGWETNRREILELVGSVPGARVLEVDYSDKARAAISEEFFGGGPVPIKDHRGGPAYCYFFGLHAAANDYVLHTDADMFFGGGSKTWLAEALDLYRDNADVLVTAPLSGPPSPIGRMRHLAGVPAQRSGVDGFVLPRMSTRLFLLSRARLRERLGVLVPHAPKLRSCLIACIDGNPLQEIPEDVITEQMQGAGMIRFEFAGRAPGCWSLHPPYRSEDFYRKLPELISRIESGTLPEGQLGDHDLNESLVDWSEAYARMARRRWWHRLGNRFRGGSR